MKKKTVGMCVNDKNFCIIKKEVDAINKHRSEKNYLSVSKFVYLIFKIGYDVYIASGRDASKALKMAKNLKNNLSK